MPEKVIVVVGSGVAGMSTAYHLAKHGGGGGLKVVLLEANDKMGGHANTLDAKAKAKGQSGMPYPCDAGFMVCNHDTYPNLLQFFADLGVPMEPTDMSFCVTDQHDRTWSFGWNPLAWARMLPTKRFWRWVYNMNRFHGEALAALEEDAQGQDETILEWLTNRGYDESVVGGWLLPFCAAVWSSPGAAAGEMHARTLFTFLRNHGFLGWRVPHWLTPRKRCGGYYLPRLSRWFARHGVEVRCGVTVVGAARGEEEAPEEGGQGGPAAEGGGGPSAHKRRVKLTCQRRRTGSKEAEGKGAKEDEEAEAEEVAVWCDAVVFATPAGICADAIRSLAPDAEKKTWDMILSGFRTHSSEVVVHSDPRRVMPPHKHWWCSWTVAKSGTFTYWLNRLQHQPGGGADGGAPLLETLNPLEGDIDEDKVHYRMTLTHPVMDARTLRSQRAYRDLIAAAGAAAAAAAAAAAPAPEGGPEAAGEGRVCHLAGAYLHHGFHEDGFRSGIEAARAVLRDDSLPLLPVPFARLHPFHRTYTGSTTHVRFAAPPGEQAGAGGGSGGGASREDKDGLHSDVQHKFKYPLTLDCVDVSGAPGYWWGGLRRADHFGDPDTPLHLEVRKRVCAETGYWPSGVVDVLANLRAYGQCFNPISLFLVWSGDDRATASCDFLVTEVTSTPWEQRAVHVLDLRRQRAGGRGGGGGASESEKAVTFVRAKTIHVSPFNPVPDGDQCWEYQVHALPGLASAGAEGAGHGGHGGIGKGKAATAATAAKLAKQQPQPPVQKRVHVTVSLFGDAARLHARRPTIVADLIVTEDEDPVAATKRKAAAAAAAAAAAVAAVAGSQGGATSKKGGNGHGGASGGRGAGGGAARARALLLGLHAAAWALAACVHPYLPSRPPPPRSLLTHLRIHYEAMRLFAKGLAFVPNTGWSAAPSDPTGAYHATLPDGAPVPNSSNARPSRSATSSCCPLGFGVGGGCGDRAPPMFLEKTGLALWGLLLLAAWALSGGGGGGGAYGGAFFALSGRAALALFVLGVAALEPISRLLPPDVHGRRRF